MSFASLDSVEPTPAVTLIDGRSGSGKTVLAHEHADRIEHETGVRPQIIAMDELYPGWGGLAEGSAALPQILRSAVYRGYDWGRGEFGEKVTIDPNLPLIVEGCGSITPQSLAAARERGTVRSVWIECPEEVRRERALGRDGDMFIPHWEAWADQERQHFATARPKELAQEIVYAS